MENALVKRMCFEVSQTCVEVQTLLLTSCVIWGNFLILSASVFLSLKENDNSTYLAMKFK